MKGAADILIDLACIPLYSLHQDLDHKNPLDFMKSMTLDLKKNRFQILGYQTRQKQRVRQETYTRRNGPMPHTSFSTGTSRLI